VSCPVVEFSPPATADFDASTQEIVVEDKDYFVDPGCLVLCTAGVPLK
jgi:hypothetical protein